MDSTYVDVDRYFRGVVCDDYDNGAPSRCETNMRGASQSLSTGVHRSSLLVGRDQANKPGPERIRPEEFCFLHGRSCEKRVELIRTTPGPDKRRQDHVSASVPVSGISTRYYKDDTLHLQSTNHQK